MHLPESESTITVGSGARDGTMSAMSDADKPDMGAADRLAVGVHDDSADSAGRTVAVSVDVGLHRGRQNRNKQGKRGNAEPDTYGITCHDQLLLRFPNAERTKTAAANPTSTHSQNIQHLPEQRQPPRIIAREIG